MNTVVDSWPLGNTERPTTAAGRGRPSLFKRFGGALWRALEATGRTRAHRELLDYADKCEALQPSLARELRAACRQGPVA